MKGQLKSEFKKLLTIRSTYGWLLLALVLDGIYSIYGEGFNDASNLLKVKPDGPAAVKMLQDNLSKVPSRILSKAGQALVPKRVRELEQFLNDLKHESASYQSL